MVFNIDSRDAGRTVLSFLKSRLKISSSALSALKRDEKGILANGEHVTVRYVLNDGDVLTINEKDSYDNVNDTIEPHEIPLNIIFESNDIIVVDKPPYMPTHPSHNHTDDTLANSIAYLYEKRGEPLVFRPIGRLDRNTSGISLIAKNAISASYLSYGRRHGMIRKKYIAILHGCIENDGSIQTISTYMKRTVDSVIMRCVSNSEDEGSFSAVTHWRLLWSGCGISVVEAIPETGRTHQLRVHFAHIGHHILGDDVYGCADSLIGRHALHAGFLSIPMPYTDTVTEFCSSPPKDMQELFHSLTGLELDEVIAK